VSRADTPNFLLADLPRTRECNATGTDGRRSARQEAAALQRRRQAPRDWDPTLKGGIERNGKEGC